MTRIAPGQAGAIDPGTVPATSLPARALLGVLALVAVVLVAIPTDRPLTEAIVLTPWAGPPALLLGNATAVLASLLALALVVRSRSVSGSLDLAGFLSISALAWGLTTLDGLHGTPWESLAGAAWLLSVAGIARFWLNFPSSLPPGAHEELRRGGEPEQPATLQAVDRAAARLGRVLQRLLPLPARWVSGVRARIQRARERPEPPWIVSYRRFLFDRVGPVAWWVASALGLVLVVAPLLGAPRGTSFFLGFLPGMFLAACGWAFALAQYRLAEGPERRRMLWVVEGLFLGLTVSTLGAQIIVLSGTWGIPDLMGAYPLVNICGGALFVASIAVATFFDGVFDPALAIRRTAVYGILVASLVFLFAVAEELISNRLLARLGIDPSGGGLAAAGLVALLFVPLQQRIERWARRVLPGVETAPTAEE